jgi:hypothetical protein
MFQAARREGLPILQAEIDRNLGLRDLPRQIRDHKIAAGLGRRIFERDLLHVSVEPTPGQPSGPEFLLARIDDEGKVTQVQA